MFGVIAAYLLGRSDGRRQIQRRRYRDRTPDEIKVMRGVAILIFILAVVVVIVSL